MQLLDSHYALTRMNLLIVASAGSAIAALLIGRSSGARLMAAIVLVLTHALGSWIAFPRAAAGPIDRRERVFGAINVSGGIAWAGYFAFILPTDVAGQWWLAMVVPVVMVANMVEAAPVAHSFVGFHVPFSLLTATAWLVLGVGDNRWASALFLVIGGYVFALGRGSHRQAHERAELTVRNASLVDDLERVNVDLEAINADLLRESYYDRLTGIPNRRALDRKLAEAFAERTTPVNADDDTIVLRDEIVALFVDLDGFKEVNDTHGHHVGDDVLAVTARRLESCIGDRGFLARYGGDEFVIVVRACSLAASSLDLADAIVSAVAEPYLIDGVPPIHIGASVGVAISSDACSSPRDLLHAADTGLYRAKQAGRGRWMAAC